MVTDDAPVNQSNKVKTFVGKTLIITLVAAYGFGFYQAVPKLIKTGTEYNMYADNCKIFLERANSAGTTGVAREELDRALSWFKPKYPQDSFEYRDLKADELYLQSQSQNSPLPASIKDSIHNSSSLIDSIELKKIDKLLLGVTPILLWPLLIFLLDIVARLLGINEKIYRILGIDLDKIN